MLDLTKSVGHIRLITRESIGNLGFLNRGFLRQSLDHQSWDRSAILGSYILESHSNVRVIPNVVFHKESLGHTAHGPLATLYLHLVGGSLEL